MTRRKRKNKTKRAAILTSIIMVILAIIYLNPDMDEIQKKISDLYNLTDMQIANTSQTENVSSYDLSSIPEYDGSSPYVVINDNIPEFTEEDYTTESFEEYSELDKLGRCGVAFANICRETMPKDDEERESISSVTPTGWVQKKYNGEYLYNRCHLIGYQLSAENANELNLITGTRYFNVTGMLPFENQVADYINNQDEDEDNHVLYRVTPYYDGDDLLASGVQIEAYSVEDDGKSICFNVYVYNVQPGITIDYATGESSLSEN